MTFVGKCGGKLFAFLKEATGKRDFKKMARGNRLMKALSSKRVLEGFIS